MLKNKTKLKRGIIVSLLTFMTLLLFICSNSVMAQNWQALPPYNLLWPLWSPALSPPNPATGVPTPLLSSVTKNTFLPIMPVLLWDPLLRDFPYILYNIPQPFGGGMVFFDQYYGLNPWPPSYLIDSTTGLPSPITLPAGFAALSPTALDPFKDFVAIANLYFLAEYPPGIFANSVSNLLTSAEIWGLPPL
ncbi:hypothetical protein JXL19_00250 [bacterium]|nr:hypothetical protein [bacterium]